MIHITIDIDGTLLDNLELQDWVRSLYQNPLVKCSILTTRHELTDSFGFPIDNSDIYEIAEKCLIHHDSIYFTEMIWKAEWSLQNKLNQDIHIDDDLNEIELFHKKTNIMAINVNEINYKQLNKIVKNYGT